MAVVFNPTPGPFNLVCRVGEQSSSMTIPAGHSDAEDQETAVKAIAQLAQPHIDGAITTLTRALATTDEVIPSDTAARIQGARVNFRNVDTGDRITVFIPWAIGLTQAAKASLGGSMAAAMSGDLATFQWVS